MTGPSRKERKKTFYDAIAGERSEWREKNSYYYDLLTDFLKFLVPEKSRVLEIGCGTGDLLASLKPARGVGVDLSDAMIDIARERHDDLDFLPMDAEALALDEKFDYVIMSDLVGDLDDVQKTLEKVAGVCHRGTRVVLTYYNLFWEPLLRAGEALGGKMPSQDQNWLSPGDIENLLELSGFETVKSGELILLPKRVPLLSTLMNRYVARLWLIRRLSLVKHTVARLRPRREREYRCTVVVPARNEEGNIERAVREIPEMGEGTEIIFIEGGSKDGTRAEIERVAGKYGGERDIRWTVQDGTGKGDAVRKGFSMARGDVLMILDADLTVRPADLPKFYEAIVAGKGEFIMGCRLVYPLEDQAMRLLNIFGNKFFGLAFSWLLDQRIKDTLCGTKVLLREDYDKIAAGREYFGAFDPFGDFDLIFGSSKLNLKIVEVPVRYYGRTYGETNIRRWSHGLLLLKMTLFAMRKIKFV